MDFSKNFVCEDIAYSNYIKNVPAPLFRKSFILDEVPESAEILICGLGFYDLFVNRKKITKGYLAPYISNSDHICYYDKYDIAKYLVTGENVIGVMLGDGHQVGKTASWDFVYNVTNSAPLLALTAEIKCKNTTLIFDAEDFVCKKGPIIFNDLRSGVFYDARLEEDGWNMPGFVEDGWHKPISGVYKPRGYAKLCDAEPIRVSKELKPVSITKGELSDYAVSNQEYMLKYFNEIAPFETAAERTGGYIYDFGENNAGTLRLKIKGQRGQKVSLQCGEQLVDGKMSYKNINFYPDGFCQRDIYYLKGGEEETFEVMFTYHGLRYVYVSGITEEQATEDLLTYLVMSSDLEKRGGFECSDDMANKIYEISQRSDISNFYYFPTDCPHREKNGWTGDASTSAEHMIMTIGVENSWREWLNNIRAAQKEDGKLPGIIPTDTWGYEWGNGPAWDRVIFELPYNAYKYRGNTELIKENADSMLRYLEYTARMRNEKGLADYGLGDWVPVVRNDGKERSDAPLDFVNAAMIIEMCRQAVEMFDAVNLPLHKSFAQSLGEEMREAVRREYIDVEACTVKYRCQSTQAMAIYYDIFNEDEKTKAFEILKDIVKEDNNNITSGYLGLRVIFHVLAQYGEVDLAYNMITKKEFPSYGYWIERGETTLLEIFAEYDEYFRSSKNHHFLGDVINWFMRYPGGINVVNHNEVKIKPYFVEKLDSCRSFHILPAGRVEVEWQRNKDEIMLNITAPNGVKCDADVPAGYDIKKISDGKFICTKGEK